VSLDYFLSDEKNLHVEAGGIVSNRELQHTVEATAASIADGRGLILLPSIKGENTFLERDAFPPCIRVPGVCCGQGFNSSSIAPGMGVFSGGSIRSRSALFASSGMRSISVEQWAGFIPIF
jgi:hypothetical protein